MIWTVVLIIFGLLIFACFYTYLGYTLAEEKYKNKMKELNETMENLNSYVRFLQVELIAERRSNINVSVDDTKEEILDENGKPII